MKKKLILIIPCMLLLVSLTETLKAQVQPALCKRTAYKTHSAEVECPGGPSFTVTASGYAEEEHVNCTEAQIIANIVADLTATHNLNLALSYIKCPPTEPEPGGGNIPEPGGPTPVPY